MDNMVKRERRSFAPLALRLADGIVIFSPAPLCHYLVIMVLLIFLGESRKWAREKDTSDERVLWSASPLALPARPNQVQENRRQASSSPARALTPSPILFELGSVHLSPYTCLLASNGLESTLNKSLIQPHYIVASATTNSDVGGVAASGRWQ